MVERASWPTPKEDTHRTQGLRLRGDRTMNPQAMTLEQIREQGLAVLRKHLGIVGMVRFLQQAETGWGNYTEERYQ